MRSKARGVNELINEDIKEWCGIAPETMSDPLFRQAAMLSKARSDYLYMVVRLLVEVFAAFLYYIYFPSELISSSLLAMQK